MYNLEANQTAFTNPSKMSPVSHLIQLNMAQQIISHGHGNQLTENALRKTRHCIMPSIVSPVRQNVPVRCLPLRPTDAVVAKLACTSALRGNELPLANALCMGFAALINRSKESIAISNTHFYHYIPTTSIMNMRTLCHCFNTKHSVFPFKCTRPFFSNK